MRVSPHSHPESIISGSTVKSMITRAKALGRTHFAYTDMGTMTALLTAYKLAQKEGLSFIPGISVLFKDLECPITKNTKASKVRYYKTTLYAHNQDQFQKLVKLTSKPRRTVLTYGQDLPLWDWSDLEEAGKIGLSLVTSDVHDLLFKNALIDKGDLILPIFEKLKGIFSDRISFAIVGSDYTRTHSEFVSIKFEDGTSDVLVGSARIKTDVAHKGKARELALKDKHKILIEGVKGFCSVKYNKKIKSAELIDGFIPLHEDLQLKCNKIAVALSQRLNVPLLYSDFAFYSEKEDKTVQDVRLTSEGFRDPTLKHMQDNEEACQYLSSRLGMAHNQIYTILSNNEAWAKGFDKFTLKYDIRVPLVDDNENALQKTMRLIAEGGRMPWGNKAYEDRLYHEIQVLANNGTANLLPYFFPIKEVQDAEMEAGVLVGPGRGSSPGSLLNYLLGITHADPIKAGLSFERFINLDRIKANDWPDIDGDRGDRTFLVGTPENPGFLYRRWGNKAAQISTRTLLRLKSSIKDVNRFLNGKVEPEIETLSKNLPAAPQGVSDQEFVFGYEDSDGNHHPGLIEYSQELLNYSTSRPKEWDIVKRCLGISRNFSAHASAFLIADKEIEDFIPMFNGERITQYEAKGASTAGGIKYDFLVVKNLLDIQKAMELVNKKANYKGKAGYFSHKGKETFIWDLEEDSDVYKSIWSGDTETLFQINTAGMSDFCKKLMPKSLREISDILALQRPGSLDAIDARTGRNMADEYIERRFGRSSSDIPALQALLPETYGVITYQEQVSKIAKELAGMTPVRSENLRRALSKKLKTEVDGFKKEFIEGASKVVDLNTANNIWDQVEAGSRYSFNFSHSYVYGMITYACMFLKHHYPLEWWTAILTNADEKKITAKLYKYVRDQVSPPDINLSTDEMVIDYDRKKIRAKLSILRGLGDKTAEPIIANRPYADISDFVKKEVAGPSLTKKLIHVGVMDSLFPPQYGLYEKLADYDRSVKMLAFDKKIASGVKAKAPAMPAPDPDYMGLHPIRDLQMKKNFLPTMPVDLTRIFASHAKIRNHGSSIKPLYTGPRGKDVPLINAESLEKILPLELDNYADFCVSAYVIEAKEFTYSNGTKNALKMILDVDGFQFEIVQWPDYDSGKLVYPKELKKGEIILAFLKKRPGKPDASVTQIIVHP